MERRIAIKIVIPLISITLLTACTSNKKKVKSTPTKEIITSTHHETPTPTSTPAPIYTITPKETTPAPPKEIATPKTDTQKTTPVPDVNVELNKYILDLSDNVCIPSMVAAEKIKKTIIEQSLTTEQKFAIIAQQGKTIHQAYLYIQNITPYKSAEKAQQNLSNAIKYLDDGVYSLLDGMLNNNKNKATIGLNVLRDYDVRIKNAVDELNRLH